MQGGGADPPSGGSTPPGAGPISRRRSLEHSYAAAVAELLDLRRELASIHASRSWRLTAPLRRRPGGHAAAAGVVRPSAAVAPVPAAGAARAAVIALGGSADAAAAVLRQTPAGLEWDLLPAPPPTDTFAAVCNAAAAAVSGGWVVLWDSTSRPQPGWLGALAASFDVIPDLGMAGAMLLDPDGRICAAGAAFAADGEPLPLGAGAAPDHPDYCFLADVDALPAGAVMVPAAVWRRFGGLDPAIASPGHALAELGLRLQQVGLRVMRQPYARLVQPSPQQAEAWPAALGRWQVRQRRLAQSGGLGMLGLRRSAPPRALFVDHFVPTPDRDSGSADLHALLRIFVGFGWQPTLLAASDLDRADHYVDDLRARGVRVVSGGLWPDMAAFLAAERVPFDLLVVSRASMASGALFTLLRRHSPFAKLVFNTVDLHFLRQERAALLERSATALDEAFRVQQAELGAIGSADCTIVLSPAEQHLLAGLLPHAPTCVIPIIRDIAGRRAPFGPRHGVVFIGGFRHRPNVDAVLFFVREIWPLLAGRLRTKLSIVGADAPAEVLALAGPDITLLGQVADLDAVLAGCRMTVAPLRYGAGIKGKVVSSLAAGVPCVASPVAVEGMGLTDGETVRVAAGPEAFAQAVLDLHEQPEQWQRLSDAGLAFAERTFSLAAARPLVAALLRSLDLPVPAAAGLP